GTTPILPKFGSPRANCSSACLVVNCTGVCIPLPNPLPLLLPAKPTPRTSKQQFRQRPCLRPPLLRIVRQMMILLLWLGMLRESNRKQEQKCEPCAARIFAPACYLIFNPNAGVSLSSW